MKANRKFHLRALIGAAILGLLVIGCSTENPMQPTESHHSASSDHPAVTTHSDIKVASDIDLPEDDPDLGPPSHRAATTGLRDTGDLGLFIQPKKIPEVEFEGAVFGVDLIDSTITFFTFTGEEWVGLVTGASELVDTAGNAVPMADFAICMSAYVQGNQVSADTLELVHVLYRSF